MRGAKGRDSSPGGANERVDAVSEHNAEARGAIAVKGRKLCAEIAHEKGWNGPRSVAIFIM